MVRICLDGSKVLPKIGRKLAIFYTMVTVLLSYVCLFSNSSMANSVKEKIFEIRITNGKVVKGDSTLRVKEDTPIKVFWTSNSPVELHLHGYDILLKLKSNKSKLMKFIAKTAGRFPISIHGLDGHDHSPLVYLEVYPK